MLLAVAVPPIGCCAISINGVDRRTVRCPAVFSQGRVVARSEG